ncbi:phytoene desaturase family protein [Microbacterium sp.]|uniref:phytoene desaturase family protein n=1 Tax=Microbacterium sp. TaxID=51671 RepID=UPI002E325ADD|nr:phytoene desaturase family protein [Microbacterium sp.]HEX5730727.1 phytoene desaturase family protein [Microbacterium sp.]
MRALVIGSGFGGLAAAIRLAAAGHEVTVLEKRERIGGRAYLYELDGFRFDGGPTVLTAPFMFEELFALADERLEDHVQLVPLDPFYRAFGSDGTHLDFHADAARMQAEVAQRSPSDEQGYARLRGRVSRIFDAFYPYTERPMMQLHVMMRMLPFLLRHRAALGVQRLVDGCIRDPFLRRALAFHPLLIGGHPSRTPALYALIVEFERRWGVHYAIGGTAALVDALGALLQRLGGRIECGVAVDRILVESGRAVGVLLADGSRREADVVVSNADPGHTYDRLLGPDRGLTGRRLRAARPSMSLHVLYFGADRTWPDTPLAHHNLLLAGDSRRVLSRVFARSRRGRATGGPLTADDLFLYVHLPTKTDPTVAPQGCEAMYVLVAAPPIEQNEAVSAASARRVRDLVVEVLDERYLPGLSSHLVVEHAIGPEHFRDVLNTPHGAAFSLQPTLFQSGWFRPHNRSGRVADLYLVGAGTHPGAGVPAVLASGKIAADLIARRGSVRRGRIGDGGIRLTAGTG